MYEIKNLYKEIEKFCMDESKCSKFNELNENINLSFKENLIFFKEFEETYISGGKAYLLKFFVEKYGNQNIHFIKEIEECPLEILTVENDDGRYFVYDTVHLNKKTFEYILNRIDMVLNLYERRKRKNGKLPNTKRIN